MAPGIPFQHSDSSTAGNMDSPGETILVIVCDHEAGGEYVAKFVVVNHPEEFAGARYAVGLYGGITVKIGGRSYYRILVTVKEACWLKVLGS
ncbi:MAG: hypothetical protein ACYCZF_13150, partial [Anaerolineae bacterium]